MRALPTIATRRRTSAMEPSAKKICRHLCYAVMPARGSAAIPSRLLDLDARRNGRDDPGGFLERFVVHALDLVPARDVRKVRISGPDVALLVLEHQQSHRPVEPGNRIGLD